MQMGAAPAGAGAAGRGGPARRAAVTTRGARGSSPARLRAVDRPRGTPARVDGEARPGAAARLRAAGGPPWWSAAPRCRRLSRRQRVEAWTPGVRLARQAPRAGLHPALPQGGGLVGPLPTPALL